MSAYPNIGEYDVNSDTISIVHDGRGRANISWLGNKILDIKNEERPTFSIRGEQCKPGQMSQFYPAGYANFSVTRQGTFFQPSSQRERCEALIAWMSKQDTIYDPKVPAGSRNYAKMYVDQLFVPVFGVPYDQISTDDLAIRFSGIRNESEVQCSKEPFVKSSWGRVKLIYDVGFAFANPAQHTPIIDARLAVRLRKKRGKLGHLLVGQPVKVTHVTTPFSEP